MPKNKIVGDPDGFRERIGLKRPEPELKLGLGLDLGTTTGYSYAWFDPDKPWMPSEGTIHYGQLDLSVGDYDSGALRFVRFKKFLQAFDPDILFFEDVHGAVNVGNFGPRPSVMQVVARVARPIEFFGSLKGTLGSWCEARNVPCKGYAIQHIKKRATGLGNANKEAVIKAANEEFDAGLETENYDKLGNDNIADSLYCLVLGLEQYSRGVPTAAEDADVGFAPAVKRKKKKRPNAAKGG